MGNISNFELGTLGPDPGADLGGRGVWTHPALDHKHFLKNKLVNDGQKICSEHSMDAIYLNLRSQRT
jgi:hypothetical protein